MRNTPSVLQPVVVAANTTNEKTRRKKKQMMMMMMERYHDNEQHQEGWWPLFHRNGELAALRTVQIVESVDKYYHYSRHIQLCLNGKANDNIGPRSGDRISAEFQ